MIETTFRYCRACANHNKIIPARYVLNDGEIWDWALCETHYKLVKYDLPLRGVTVTELSQAEMERPTHVAEYNRKMENDARS